MKGRAFTHGSWQTIAFLLAGLAAVSNLEGQSQPTSISFSPGTVEQGECYTIRAGNAANITLDLRYRSDGGSTQTIIGWPTLNSSGEYLACTSSSTPVGTHVFTGYRNTLASSWISISKTVIVTAPPTPDFSLSVSPSSGSVTQGSSRTRREEAFTFFMNSGTRSGSIIPGGIRSARIMFRYGYLSLLSFLLGGLLAAQHRVQETRLLAPRIGLQPRLLASGGLGSKLFAYSQSNQYGWSVLFCLEGEREVSILERPYDVPIGEDIYAVQVARDDSRIFFASGGPTSHFPTAIHSVRPDGSQLSTLVKSGDDCDEFVYPGYGTHLCSLPLEYQLSPDGRKILFVNKVREIRKLNDEERTRFYLSMVPVTGGPIVRLEEIGDGFDAVWSEDGTSIYYYYSRGRDPWNGVPRRYDLETGRSEFLTDEAWKALPPLAVSRADGALYFRSKQGFVRLDPETGEVEVIVEEHFDTFDLSPDGLRAVGIKEGDVTIVNLEFPSTARLVMETGTVDELELGQIPVARERWAIRKLRRGHSPSASEARKKTGVIGIRWLDNERLWCVVQEDRSTDPTRASKPEVRVGIVRLAN